MFGRLATLSIFSLLLLQLTLLGFSKCKLFSVTKISMHYFVNVCNSSVSYIEESVTKPVTAKCVTSPPKIVYSDA